MEDTVDDIEIEESGEKVRRPGFPVEPRRLLRLVAEHRALLLRAFVAASLLALILSFFLPKRYESSAQLLYEGIPVLEPDEKAASPAAFAQSATGANRLRQVREQLGWRVSLRELRQRVDVQLDAGNAMRITGEAASADEALALTKAMVDVFVAGQRRFNTDRLDRLRAENELALQHAQQQQEQALAGYEQFRKKSGKSNLLEEQKELALRAKQLRAQVEEAAVESAAQKARIEELEQAQRELPRQIVSSAKVGSPVDSPLARARAELAEARASLSEEHPRVQALKERVASLQAQRGSQKSEVGDQTLVANPARASVDQQIATAKAALAAAEERESALRVLLESVQKEADALAPEEGEARKVVRELEVAEERLEALSQQAAKIRDASVRPLTGFRILSPPVLPEESKRSKAHVLALVLLPVATVLVLALALIVRRLRTLTVEAPREVAWWGNGPVLGTSVWPRDPKALDSFVNELEDQGMYGAGRTLVVPATETEREIACSFALRLAEAPWLAAAILDVEARAPREPLVGPLVTPAPSSAAGQRPRRLSSQATPSVLKSRVVSATPSSRPPHKPTVVGLPAAQSLGAASEPPPQREPSGPVVESPPEPSPGPAGPEPFRRRRHARATIRMVVPNNDRAALAAPSASDGASQEAEAFLLTRPVMVDTEHQQGQGSGPPWPESNKDSARATASNAVMRAAVRLLGDDSEDTGGPRHSLPPSSWAPGQLRGVALAWNGPLSGPVLRRAARLAHRVMVVVSSGMGAIELTKVKTRLGRERGVGYVLVNVADAYVDLEDRVGPVEAFWHLPPEAQVSGHPRSR